MSKRLGGKQKLDKSHLDSVPDKPGVYVIRNKKGDVQYVGMSKQLKTRIAQHADQKDVPGASSVQTRTTRSEKRAQRLEEDYIKRYKPKYNIQKNK